jgi:hypothetical protein
MFQHIQYGGKTYGIMTVQFKKNKIPVIVDIEDEPLIKKIGENWSCNVNGIVSHPFIHNGETKEIKLHDVIMFNANANKNNKTVVHIDKLGLDNRRENLMRDDTNKDVTKNMKKKQRTIILPEKSGINPDELPTYVWYIKPEGTHGERFIVNVGDLTWKTTSSKKVSLRCKLEEAKAFLRKLKEEKPDVFKTFSMNGDFNSTGENLLETFYRIIYKAGFDNIKKIPLPNATEKYLIPQQVNSPMEIYFLHSKLQ